MTDRNKEAKHIAIAGNIGSGKTTLTRMLAKTYGWTPFFEPGDNPYLTDYYHDMRRWAFNTQVHFLCRRLRDAMEISRSESNVVQDRTIYEDAHIFAHNLHKLGLMSDRDFANYCDLFVLMTVDLPWPDLLVYLRGSIATLASHIQSRGRTCEQGISIEYLQGLNALYEKWIAKYDGELLIVDIDKCHFATEPRDFQAVASQIDSRLFGLF